MMSLEALWCVVTPLVSPVILSWAPGFSPSSSWPQPQYSVAPAPPLPLRHSLLERQYIGDPRSESQESKCYFVLGLRRKCNTVKSKISSYCSFLIDFVTLVSQNWSALIGLCGCRLGIIKWYQGLSLLSAVGCHFGRAEEDKCIFLFCDICKNSFLEVKFSICAGTYI